jgi:hypothetical protein
MTSPRKKPAVVFWATVVVVALLVVYPLSAGPACRLAYHGWLPGWAEIVAVYLYTPLVWLVEHSQTAKSLMRLYVGLWSDILPRCLAD